MKAKLACPSCHTPIGTLPTTGKLLYRCTRCGLELSLGPQYVRYEFDRLLFDRFKRKYLLNKVLNNNGLIGYELLREGSISLPSRGDVQRFRKFLVGHARSGVMLDIGCGVLEVPGYLEFESGAEFELVGLDPIDNRSFRGLRIVGCSEFMPFPDASIDTAVFATSLDHVCSLTATTRETARVLKPDGRVIVWMGDRSVSVARRILRILRTWVRNVAKGYRTDRYWVYPNGTVLLVPPGAVDPFHSYHEDPRRIVRLMRDCGLRLIEHDSKVRDEVFLCFAKSDDCLTTNQPANASRVTV
jgi:SAM-dependent methyltransferase